jgi:hypothetical protein
MNSHCLELLKFVDIARQYHYGAKYAMLLECSICESVSMTFTANTAMYIESIPRIPISRVICDACTQKIINAFD